MDVFCPCNFPRTWLFAETAVLSKFRSLKSTKHAEFIPVKQGFDCVIVQIFRFTLAAERDHLFHTDFAAIVPLGLRFFLPLCIVKGGIFADNNFGFREKSVDTLNFRLIRAGRLREGAHTTGCIEIANAYSGGTFPILNVSTSNCVCVCQVKLA